MNPRSILSNFWGSLHKARPLFFCKAQLSHLVIFKNNLGWFGDTPAPPYLRIIQDR